MTAQTILPANSVSDTAFNSNSCRFDGTGAYMSKTPGSDGDAQKMTTSIWFKRGVLGRDIRWFEMGDLMLYSGTNIIGFANRAFDFDVYTESNFLMDTAAWYHIVWSVDTTQSTAANRVKIYVNGVLLTSANGLHADTSYMDQNANLECNQQEVHRVGAASNNANDKFDGYMSEFVHIDGAQLAPTSFGESDSDSGIWVPIEVSGLTFGTNGFYLDFKSSGNLGNDANGGTDLTETGLAAIDQSTDTPTNNFATFKSNHPAIANTAFSEGNLQFSSDGNVTTQAPASSSIAVSTGKWYAEFKVIAESTRSGSYSYVGVAGTALWVSAANNSYYIGNQADTIGYNGNAAVYSNGNEVDGSETNYANGNIVGVAADFTNSKIYFSVNGTYINSGDPAGAANGYDIPATAEGFYYFAVSVFGQNATWQANFGSPPYAISSSNRDANDHGNFEYAVPSGFFALNTKNLAEHG